jgi:hypothetical protein
MKRDWTKAIAWLGIGLVTVVLWWWILTKFI